MKQVLWVFVGLLMILVGILGLAESFFSGLATIRMANTAGVTVWRVAPMMTTRIAYATVSAVLILGGARVIHTRKQGPSRRKPDDHPA